MAAQDPTYLSHPVSSLQLSLGGNGRIGQAEHIQRQDVEMLKSCEHWEHWQG